jgi:hypothetical protein
MTRRLVLLSTIALLASAGSALASCIPRTHAQQRAAAGVIFDGVALEGPTATGIQRFSVTRYLKASGPRVVRVSTGNVKRSDGTGSITSVSIDAGRGQKWRIFGSVAATKAITTTLCSGSHKI